MRTELPVLSFLCVAFLTLLSPLHWKSRNVAVLSIVFWLFASNLIQGVNTTVWSGNVTIRNPVWCDIATKIRMGSQVSLAAACACICQHLFFLSANPNTKKRQHRTFVECSICVVLPFLYMALHTIVQKNRFDLSPHFGCTSSTYISTPAIILVWIPPFILCSIALAYAILALSFYFGRTVKLSDGSRIPLHGVNWTFLRPLLTTVFISLLIFTSSIFSLSSYIRSAGGLQSWSSWSHVHSRLGDVSVVTSQVDLSRIEVEWWVSPASTLIFFFTTIVGIVSGAKDDSMFGFTTISRWYKTRILGRTVDMDSFIHSSDCNDTPTSITLQSRSTPSPTKPPSGWNDTLRFADGPKKMRPKLKGLDDVPPSPCTSDTESDASFIVSTLNYVQTPMGRKALGLASPTKESHLSIPEGGAPAMAGTSNRNRLSLIDPTLEQLSQSANSQAPSILSTPWPEPPSTLPNSPVNLTLSREPSPPLPALLPGTSFSSSTSAPNPVPNINISAAPSAAVSSRKYRRQSNASLTGSMSSSTISYSGYMSDAIFIPAPHETRPFEGSGVPAEAVTPPPHAVRKMRSKDSFAGRALHLGGTRTSRRERRERGQEEAVYMTVVHETV